MDKSIVLPAPDAMEESDRSDLGCESNNESKFQPSKFTCLVCLL